MWYPGIHMLGRMVGAGVATHAGAGGITMKYAPMAWTAPLLLLSSTAVGGETCPSDNKCLTTVVERFKGEKLAGHVTLTKGERSALAELATHRL